MLRALHLFDPQLRLAHRDLSWVMWQLVDVQERALHLLRGVALQHMHWNAASFSLHDRRATLFELIPNGHHGICLIGGACGGRGEAELSNRCLELLA